MKSYSFIDGNGTFELKDADRMSYLYFPVASVNGMMGAVTPELGGDLKTSQNTFILEPVSSDNLHNNRSTRNFWISALRDGDSKAVLVSATGASAAQHASKASGDKDADQVTVYGGLLYQRVVRQMPKVGLKCEVTTFVPSGTDVKAEITRVDITNTGSDDIHITPTAAVPIYGRSADNIRDHRNVTSMLNRVLVTEYGIVNDPTLTFDERGHRRNKISYGLFAADVTDGTNAPAGFCPVVEDYIGEGGTFDAPSYPAVHEPEMKPGDRVDGFEVIGAARFDARTIKASEKASYIFILTLNENGEAADDEATILSHASSLQKDILPFLNSATERSAFEAQKEYWIRRDNVRFRSGDKSFDNWMYWVGIQPMLRRIYGCSFLPHHDYGKGGRGWRDLWQDCLALIIMDPSDVRDMLAENFGGVRTDGTNATIIGSGRGEFIADRNGITRVWMDHAMWPFMTMELYINQSGDFGILDETAPYFIDRQVMRGEKLLSKDDHTDDDIASMKSEGTVLEHLLLQNMAAFFDIGEHGHMRIRGADWNDALDMAAKRGESVAFTAAYAGNMRRLASLLDKYSEVTHKDSIEMASEIELLFGTGDSDDDRRDILSSYCSLVKEGFKAPVKSIKISDIREDLLAKAEHIAAHITESEWFTDASGYSRFNGYYDDSGRPLESIADGRMMLTSQVFTIMSGIASEEQISGIVRSADKYIYDEAIGGYRLNTNFREVKTDMGRMFGFAYGQKENGAVFSHMTTMYGNALYTRGFKKEGFKVIDTLYRHAADFESAGIYPGVPEYFDPKGRGVYHYLTGAASWLMLTVLTEMFGVKGQWGDIVFEPKLLPEQFDGEGKAGVSMEFNGCPIDITYVKTSSGDSVTAVEVDGVVMDGNRVPADKLSTDKTTYIRVTLD